MSAEEVTRIKTVSPDPDGPPPPVGGMRSSPQVFEKLPPPVPWWAKVGLSLLVPFLPLLAILTIVLRIAFRSQPRNVRFAWVSFLSTLLVVSAFVTTAGTVLFLSFAPMPAITNAGLPDLDERDKFVSLPAAKDLSSSDASGELKPLVVVVSPVSKLWNRQEVAAPEFGAGVLIYGDKEGYLFATANHVANHGGGSAAHALVATASGLWATASIVAHAPSLDLALLWVGRHSGAGDFVQPLATAQDGANIFVIGHPEGFKYTLSTGIVSGLRDQSIQISAAVSPGNSGGPVYDDRGNLVGIVSSKFDHNQDANAENLGFAAKADALLQVSDWSFQGNGRQLLGKYIEAVKKQRDGVKAEDEKGK